MSDATAFTDHRARAKLAERGKSAEETCRKYFMRKGEQLGTAFAWERIPDARMAGGRFPGVAGDFRAFYLGANAIIEVKETKTVDRLPKGNFKVDAIARCYLKWLAGAIVIVIVHHVQTGRWVVMPIEHFYENDVPSWKTTGFPSFYSAEEALDFGLAPLFNR